jgi:hypothetical protein
MASILLLVLVVLWPVAALIYSLLMTLILSRKQNKAEPTFSSQHGSGSSQAQSKG